MNRDDYNKLTIKQLMGRKVKTLQPLSNYTVTVKPGTLATILDKRDGFLLKTDPCPQCGITTNLYHVPPEAVELLLEGGRQPALIPDDAPLFEES